MFLINIVLLFLYSYQEIFKYIDGYIFGLCYISIGFIMATENKQVTLHPELQDIVYDALQPGRQALQSMILAYCSQSSPPECDLG